MPIPKLKILTRTSFLRQLKLETLISLSELKRLSGKIDGNSIISSGYVPLNQIELMQYLYAFTRKYPGELKCQFLLHM